MEFVRDIGMSNESPLDVSILNNIENNGDNNLLPQSESAIEPNLMDSNLLTNENLNHLNIGAGKKFVGIENIDIENVKELQNNYEPISILYQDNAYTPGLTLFVEQEETEKKIMRVKRKGKAAKPKETFDYSKYLAINNKKNISLLSSSPAEKQTKQSPVHTFLSGLEPHDISEVDLKNLPTIYMCATCNSQFPNVEACKEHYVKVHKYANQADESSEITGIKVENDESSERNAQENKKILEKFFSQDVMKKRKHKYVFYSWK